MIEITETGAAMAAAYMQAKQGTVDVHITLEMFVNVPADKATDKIALAAAAAQWIQDQAEEPEGDEELATRLQIVADDAGDDGDPDREAAILELAGEQWAEDGKVEIDDDAKVSEGDANGAYVQAWVWVDFHGTDLDKDEEDEETVEGEDDLDCLYSNLEAAGAIGPKVAPDA
jgi:hypothetical protein